MTKILIFVDGEGYWAMGEEAFDAVMNEVGITLKKDERTVQKWTNVNMAFWSYGMTAVVMEGTIPDDMDMAKLDENLKARLGEVIRPIIFMYIDRGDEE